MTSKRTYASTEYSVEVRELIGRLWGPLRERGVTIQDYLASLADAGYAVPRTSLDRWAARSTERGTPFKKVKLSGREALLDDEQEEVAAGWVLCQVDRNIPVSAASFTAFCRESFGVSFTEETGRIYLHALGFTCKVAHHRTSGFTLDRDSLAKSMAEWALDEKRAIQAGVAAGNLTGLMASLDFTFTGQRTRRVTSFAPTGDAQPKSAGGISQFTNAIITCVWSDGVNRTPSVLFTFNGKFRHDRVAQRYARQEWRADKFVLDGTMKRLGIAPSRVIYIGDEKRETRIYVPESPVLIRRFFDLYQVPEGCVIFSDNGKSMYENKTSVLLNLGFARHSTYPAAVHQYLSPNDNRLHGAAKQQWRNMEIDFKDDVSASLELLRLLDEDTVSNSKLYFINNITSLTLDSALAMLRGRWGKMASVDTERRVAYRVFAGLDARGDRRDVPDELRDTLDGRAWR